jgi:acetylornithine deacetylase
LLNQTQGLALFIQLSLLKNPSPIVFTQITGTIILQGCLKPSKKAPSKPIRLYFCTMGPEIDILLSDAVLLLKELIKTPSLSRQESSTAAIIQAFLSDRGIASQRHINNVWAVNAHFDASKPSILLNSHHDTVKPNASYTLDPYAAIEKNGKLFGLGSNDAGGCLVALIATFLHYYQEPNLNYNLVLLASAEEEISGTGGVEAAWPHLPKIAFAIVGEPTLLDLAIAEKGLLVVDCTANGVAGHAARNEGQNAIYKALADIAWVQNYRFDRLSEQLGQVKMSVTIIGGGSQHNVVPDTCTYTIDIRVTDAYTHEEILDTLKANLKADLSPRSMRLRSSGIEIQHPAVQRGMALGAKTYGSPTLSDQALMPVPSLKCGPGDSARSHMADEFIFTDEIARGIQFYIALLKDLTL